MDRTKRQARLDRIAETNMDIDASRFRLRRARELGESRELAVIDRGKRPAGLCRDIMTMTRQGYRPKASLRFTNGLELVPCTSAGDGIAGRWLALPFGVSAGELEKRSSKFARPIDEVLGSVLVLQHGKNIARFKRWSNAPADRLIARSCDDPKLETELRADVFERRRKLGGGV